MRGHGQQPRSWAIVLIRGGLALLVLAGIVWFTQSRPRIAASKLERDVSGRLRATPAHCSDQSGNGSGGGPVSWALHRSRGAWS